MPGRPIDQITVLQIRAAGILDPDRGAGILGEVGMRPLEFIYQQAYHSVQWD